METVGEHIMLSIDLEKKKKVTNISHLRSGYEWQRNCMYLAVGRVESRHLEKDTKHRYVKE